MTISTEEELGQSVEATHAPMSPRLRELFEQHSALLRRRSAIQQQLDAVEVAVRDETRDYRMLEPPLTAEQRIQIRNEIKRLTAERMAGASQRREVEQIMNEHAITDVIHAAAKTTAEQLLAECCEDWCSYRAVLLGDLDGLAEDLGRKPTAEEVTRFEAVVRERLRVALDGRVEP